ncbi:bifunctional DNA primase/polymerase [Pseudomonas sp. BN417]|uniref:bifunctional DNA primase/polymerase n=1 Tax=Pseudomonas sp. BN417 TaxID=2567890 RepID=UPI002457B625|nr:bifunctional DNA primase/polymerase [Pseudomonas sp. BN417]MDH4557974.1 bifunctional DNA primase/polymerase [Pseudomonas sp. BN417]
MDNSIGGILMFCNNVTLSPNQQAQPDDSPARTLVLPLDLFRGADDNRAAAAIYLGHRLVCIPLVAQSKQPVMRFKHLSGFDTFDEVPAGDLMTAQIPWRYDPRLGIGVLLRPSGLVVIDCDSSAAVAEAIANTPEPCNNIVRTSKGAHLYYYRPAHCPSARAIQKGSSQAIDVLADGFTVAPPSLHPSGNQYEWLCAGTLQPAPEWAVGLLMAAHARHVEAVALDSNSVMQAFPNTAEDAACLLDVLRFRDPKTADLLSVPGMVQHYPDRSRCLWLAINTLRRLTQTDAGVPPRKMAALRARAPELSDESIAKVIWFGALGSQDLAEKPKAKGWQWFCDEIARARAMALPEQGEQQ